MAVTLSGDNPALARLIAQVGKLARKELLPRIVKNLQEEAIALVTEGFKAETDPYGSRWAPLARARRRGGSIVLTNTARLRRSFTRLPATADGFRIGSNVGYGAHHQFGTRWLPRRMMVPIASRGLGPIWSPRFVAVARRILARNFGR